MSTYLGETILVNLEGTKFANYTEKDWALLYLERYGWIDGDHHQKWLNDQLVKILTGSPIEVRVAKWDDGQQEYRFSVYDSPAYDDWVTNYCNGVDGPDTYSWDTGTPP